MKPEFVFLTVVSILAGVMIGGPATAAGGELWWFDHREGRFGTAELPKAGEPNISGLVLTDKNGEKYGACKETTVKAQIVNRFGGMAEASIAELGKGPGECTAVPAGCKLEKFEPTFEPAWQFTQQATKEVRIKNFSVTVKLDNKCTAALAEESTVSGTVEKGTEFVPWSEAGGPELKFNKAQIGESEVYLDGVIGFGTFLTLLEEPTGFKVETTPSGLAGIQLEPSIFVRKNGNVQCETATLTGELADEATSVTVTPAYEECASEVGPATVQMNGCVYQLNLEAVFVEGEKYKYLAPAELLCEGAAEPELEVFLTAGEHAAESPICTYGVSVPAEAGIETIELTNKAPVLEPVIEKGWLEAHIEATGLVSKLLNGPLLFCGPEIDNGSKLYGRYQVNGTEPETKAFSGIAVFPE